MLFLGCLMMIEMNIDGNHSLPHLHFRGSPYWMISIDDAPRPIKYRIGVKSKECHFVVSSFIDSLGRSLVCSYHWMAIYSWSPINTCQQACSWGLSGRVVLMCSHKNLSISFIWIPRVLEQVIEGFFSISLSFTQHMQAAANVSTNDGSSFDDSS